MDILLVLIVALIVVLVWRGPSMLPQFGEALGKTIKGARDNFNRDSTDNDGPADSPETTAKAAAKPDEDTTAGQ